jgi:hypothetical protein
LINSGVKQQEYVSVEGEQWLPEGKPLVQGAGCPKKGQLFHTPQIQDDRWIFASKNVTYQKPPFWVR